MVQKKLYVIMGVYLYLKSDVFLQINVWHNKVPAQWLLMRIYEMRFYQQYIEDGNYILITVLSIAIYESDAMTSLKNVLQL